MIKKKMSRPLVTKKQRFEILLEEIRSEVHVVHEQTSDLLELKPIVKKHTEQLEKIQDDVDILKSGHRDHSERLGRIESKQQEHSDQLKKQSQQLEQIETKLTSKADSKRVEAIERKLGVAHA